MRVTEMRIHKYVIPFRSPFKSAQTELSYRSGFYAALFSNSGIRGIGEAASFPQFGSETCEETYASLLHASKIFPCDVNLQSPETLCSFLDSLSVTPSARSALEQALLSKHFSGNYSLIASFFSMDIKPFIPVNASLGIMPPDELLAAASQKRNEGFAALKIKIGREDPQEDIRAIRLLREQLGYSFRLRIDANGAYAFATARSVLMSLQKYDIEYCEDPTADVSDFRALEESSGIPVAVDEALCTEESAARLLSNKICSICILKPALLGGIGKTRSVLRLANRSGMKPVITTALESAVGRSIAVLTAASLEHETACGLATGGLYSAEPFDDLFLPCEGRINTAPFFDQQLFQEENIEF